MLSGYAIVPHRDRMFETVRDCVRLAPVLLSVAVKYVVFVPDGCADVPLAELGGRTPLEAARMPRLAALAARGEVGRAAVIPTGLPPGSDVGNMAILGFDPARYHTGRAPIEAAAMGVELGPDEVAYRCNLVTRLRRRRRRSMVDFAAGHIYERAEPSDRRRARRRARQRPRRRALPSRRRVPPPLRRAARLGRRRVHAAARSHRHARGVPDRSVGAEGAGVDGRVARGRARRRARGRRDATQIWLWGQGVKPALPTFDGDLRRRRPHVVGRRSRAGARCAHRYRGRRRAGRDRRLRQRLRGPGATRASRSLDDRDLFVLHIEATDEAGPPRSRRREGRRARAMGHRRDRSDRRRARRAARSRTGSCSCPTTRRRARS